MGFVMKVLWQDHTFVMKCTVNAFCLLNTKFNSKGSMYAIALRKMSSLRRLMSTSTTVCHQLLSVIQTDIHNSISEILKHTEKQSKACFNHNIFESTCATCSVRSYPSLSVRLSVTRPKLLDNNSYLEKYCT